MTQRSKWLLTTLFVFALGLSLFAQPVSQLKPTDYVNDFAHVLNADTKAKISSIAQQLDTKGNAQVTLVTINTLEGRDIESYSVDLFKQWGVGRKGTDRGVLILYVIQDHKARIEVGYGLEPILPDGKVGGFQREAIPLMRSGDYNSALMLVFGRVAQTIAADANIQLTDLGSMPRAPTRNQDEPQGLTLGQIIFGIIILIIILATPLRGILFWMLLSGIGGGGRGGGWSGGGGGFGGGGGGFGGFGGGSSGGGGASSSW
jgi:uncharacterized protein